MLPALCVLLTLCLELTLCLDGTRLVVLVRIVLGSVVRGLVVLGPGAAGASGTRPSQRHVRALPEEPVV